MESKIEKYTKRKDSEGNKIYLGDTLFGSYGIPPVSVRAKVEYDGDTFILKTPDHNPKQVTLKDALEHLYPMYKESTKTNR